MSETIHHKLLLYIVTVMQKYVQEKTTPNHSVFSDNTLFQSSVAELGVSYCALVASKSF